MFDLARLTFVTHAPREAFAQTQPVIQRLEQHRTAVRTAVRLVKLRYHPLIEQPRKQNTLSCAIVSHAKALHIDNSLVSQRRITMRWAFVQLPS